nr:uncharacterized protein LOC109153162 isoform X1 [Ipomoea batatas]
MVSDESPKDEELATKSENPEEVKLNSSSVRYFDTSFDREGGLLRRRPRRTPQNASERPIVKPLKTRIRPPTDRQRVVVTMIEADRRTSLLHFPVPPLRCLSGKDTQVKQDKNADLSSKIEQGFGANGLGLLSISDVPEYSLLRKNLLHLSTRLANVSEDVKRELEDPDSRYSFGWSYGKEKQDGKLDKLKASFFANPILDVPTTEPSNIQCKISFLCSVGSDTMLLESSFSKGVRNARPSSFVEA